MRSGIVMNGPIPIMFVMLSAVANMIGLGPFITIPLLMSALGGHEERDRDERSDPDHVRHVERRGVNQAEAALHQTLEPPGAIRAMYRPRPASPEGSCCAERPARWNAESISSTVNRPNSCTSAACRVPSAVSIV